MGRRAGRRSARIGFAMVAFLILPALGALALPDLQIANPTLVPEIVEQGEITFIRASVSSSGFAGGDAVIVRIALRRVDLQEECCYSERALTSQQVRSGYLLEEPIDTSSREPGTYAITISVDPAGLVAEEDETNNQAILFLQVLALKSELHPQQLISEPASPVDRGQAVAIATEIENSGHREAGGFSVVFSLFPAFAASSGSSVPTLQFSPATSEGNLDAATVDDPSGLDFETWFEEVGRSLGEDAWIPFWSANVSGLDLDDDIKLASVLPTGQGLRDLLVPAYLMSDEMALLQDGTTVYAIRVVVDPPQSGDGDDLSDPAGSVVEEDESNNMLVGALTVRPSTLALPELHLTNLYLEGPLPLESGDRQDITVVVVNTGGSPAPVGEGTPAPVVEIEVLYRRAGVGSNQWQSLGTETIATTGDRLGIEEGNNTVEDNNLEISVTGIPLDPGSYELKAVVDPANQVEEQNEDNNELTISFSVEGGELHPIGILVASDELRQGGAFSLSTPIRNTGKLALTSFVVGFFLDDVRFDTFYYYESASGNRDGGVEEDEIAWAQGVLDTEGVPPGEYELRVVVDPDNAIPEMDEENNEIARTVKILPREARKPELVPVSLTLEPNSPLTELSDAGVEVEILNRGTLDASGFVVALELQATGAAGGSWTRVAGVDGAEGVLVPALSRGGRTILAFSLRAANLPEIGPYQLRAVVDAFDQIAELDEENNTLSIGLRVGPPEAEFVPPSPYANLVFKALTVAPTQNLDAREEITVQEAIVWNAGQEASGAFDVSLCWRDASGLCVPVSDPIRILGLDAETEIELAAQLPAIEASVIPGSYQIVGIVDATDEVDEHGREQDNSAIAYVQVTGMVKPDLTIDGIWFSSESPIEVGEKRTAFARVRNRSGDVGASAFKVRFEQIEGGPIHDVVVERLGPNGTLDLPFSLSTSFAGEFALRVTVDVENAVTETDDDDLSNNNSMDATFTVAEVEPVSVAEAANLGGSVRHLVVDPAADVLFAASAGGRIVAFRHADATDVVFDVTLGDGVVGLAFVDGVALYIGTESGSLHVLNPMTGVEQDEIVLPAARSITWLEAGANGTLYVGTTKGIMSLDAMGSLTTAVVPSEVVSSLEIDASDGFVHAVTDASVYTLDPQLVFQCQLTDLPGTLSAVAVGPGAVYVGTQGGVLFAYSRCGAGASWRWRYPRDVPLGSAVTAVVVDPGDFDPIYIATADGRLIALDAFGSELWVHTATSGLPAEPVWDGRTGRVFFVDGDGTPYVLSASGSEAVTIDAAVSAGVSVSSPLAIDEYIAGLGSDARLVRVYYYGADDGVVYVIRTDR